MFAVILIIGGMSKDCVSEMNWIGIASAIGVGYAISKWNTDRIEELENEVKQLKKILGKE